MWTGWGATTALLEVLSSNTGLSIEYIGGGDFLIFIFEKLRITELVREHFFLTRFWFNWNNELYFKLNNYFNNYLFDSIITFSGLKECDGEAVHGAAVAPPPITVFPPPAVRSLSTDIPVGLVELDDAITKIY